jgi:cytochrome c biogenesis protein
MTTTASTTETGAGGSASQPPQPPSAPPALSPVELSRWAWRQLTSMRTALVLLFLLALAAVPGSVVPQQNIDAVKVADWQDRHPQLTPVYEKLGLFSVYSSVWFSAIYILLMVSLVGCIVPRLRIYWRAFRAAPPRVPRHLDRLPESRRFELDEDADAVLARARAVLRGRRYRVADHGSAVSAERGYLREAGNLLFHLSVLVVLVGFAYGQMFGYKGSVVTVVGQGFSNSLSQYDDFAPGRLFSPDDLAPVSLHVDDFHVKFLTSGPEMGQPESFDANITYHSRPGAPAQRHDLAVNHPLTTNGTSVFLVGHGYAPVVTVRDGQGNVAYKGPVVFLPQDPSFRSVGVIKVLDAQPQQLGFEGFFLPTYGFTMQQGPFSQFPDALDPVMSLTPYHGDLGLDSGKPQSVYSLDKSKLESFPSSDPKRLGPDARIKLSPGQTVRLPDGLGSIRFDGVKRWVKLQVSHSPGKGIALGGVLLGIVGLMGSLFIRPRRAWVRVTRTTDDTGRGRTVVELAGLDRSSGGDLTGEVDELERSIRTSDIAPHEESPA